MPHRQLALAERPQLPPSGLSPALLCARGHRQRGRCCHQASVVLPLARNSRNAR